MSLSINDSLNVLAYFFLLIETKSRIFSYHKQKMFGYMIDRI